MKLFKRIIFIICAVIILFGLYLSTLDGDFDVKRSRIIKAPAEVVYNELIDYKNWKDWGPWFEQDSTMVVTYGEKTNGVCGYYSWMDQEGGGSMKTISVNAPNHIVQEIKFNSPFGEMGSEVYWQIDSVAEGSKVTWGMRGTLDFVFRMAASEMENDIGPMEERGLELIEQEIEKNMAVFSIEHPGVILHSGGYYLYTSTSCAIAEMNGKFAPMMKQLEQYAAHHKLRTTGHIFTLYHQFDQESGNASFSVCLPIEEKPQLPYGQGVLVSSLNQGAYFKTVLKGSYQNSGAAWAAGYKAVEESIEYVIDDKREPLEVYFNNPRNTPNPADLITEIYLPVLKVDSGS